MNYINSNGLIMGCCYAIIVTDFEVTCSAASSASASAFAAAATASLQPVAAVEGSFGFAAASIG